ncbi:transcriptional adapter 2-beta-like protein [Leptotrombidium deliense]|uniref:Transcriptional adapter 2-beta-like protein n=1 Tax=Leptotrombidium deliense TaxID=299467 RepID=A0A443SJB5_9ACAR|nr:transcriptional adapter 2-beta-like protein [Leptotrombidium deliense]
MSKSKVKSKTKNSRTLKAQQEFGTFPIFESEPEWKATEELALLEAVESYGFGNWGDCAEYINSYPANEVKQHFLDYYVEGCIGQLTWSAAKAVEVKPDLNRKGALSPSFKIPLKPIPELTAQEQQFLGYMPKRDDFEREFDNEAESLVSMLSINPNDDDELDVDLKLAHIDMFRRRLLERFRRKQIVREYNLVEKFYKAHGSCEELQAQLNQMADWSDNCNNTSKNIEKSKKKTTSTPTKNTNDDKDLHENVWKIYSQFDSFDDHKRIVDGFQKEKELKVKIKELTRYRRNGITKLNEGTLFDTARNKRDKKKENQKKSLGNIEESISSGRRSIHTTPEKKCSELASNKGGSQASLNDSSKSRNSNQGKIGSKESNLASDLFDRRGAKEEFVTGIVEGDSKSSHSGKLSSLSFTKQKSDPSYFPSRLLSEREKKLCTSLKLKPSQYITLKTLILKSFIDLCPLQDCYDKRRKGLAFKSSVENIDKLLRRKVQSFMAKSGWIRIS